MCFLSNREEEDARAAQQLAKELEKEEELQRKVTAIRDEQLARRLQSHVPKAKKNSVNRQERYEALTGDCEPLSTSMRSMDLNQPMTEEEARQWQELCDAVRNTLSIKQNQQYPLLFSPTPFLRKWPENYNSKRKKNLNGAAMFPT